MCKELPENINFTRKIAARIMARNNPTWQPWPGEDCPNQLDTKVKHEMDPGANRREDTECIVGGECEAHGQREVRGGRGVRKTEIAI